MTSDGDVGLSNVTGERPGRERASLLNEGGDKGRGFADMLVPVAPHSPHGLGASLVEEFNDEDDAARSVETFELEDGHSDDDFDDDCSNEGGGAHGMAHGTASPSQVAVNIFISFVGAGLLGLPYAFSRSGWVLGSVALFVTSASNVYAMLLLVKCRKFLESKGNSGIKGYGDVGKVVMGPRGEVVVNICLIVSQAGFATAYLIFIATNVQSISKGDAGRALIIYACVPVLALLVQFRDMKKLSPFSLLADVANLLGLSAVIFQDFEYFTHGHEIKKADFTGLIYVISVVVYSMEGVGLILPLESSCANRDGFPRLLKQVVFGITVIMAFFGTCGYVAFGEDTISPISLNLRGNSAAFVQLALCLALYLTYPIMMFPVSDILEDLLLSDSRKPPHNYWPSRIFRVLMVLSTATCAYSIPNFGKFLELVGSSICTLLGFIFPCYFHLKIFGMKNMKVWEACLDITLIVFGMVFGFLGTYEAVMKLLEKEDPTAEL